MRSIFKNTKMSTESLYGSKKVKSFGFKIQIISPRNHMKMTISKIVQGEKRMTLENMAKEDTA